MKNDSDILMMNIFQNDLNYTGIGHEASNRIKLLLIDLNKRVAKIQLKTAK